MLCIDILYAFEAFESVACTAEERTRLKQVRYSSSTSRCANWLKRVMIREKLIDKIYPVTRHISGNGKKVKEHRNGV